MPTTRSITFHDRSPSRVTLTHSHGTNGGAWVGPGESVRTWHPDLAAADHIVGWRVLRKYWAVQVRDATGAVIDGYMRTGTTLVGALYTLLSVPPAGALMPKTSKPGIRWKVGDPAVLMTTTVRWEAEGLRSGAVKRRTLVFEDVEITKVGTHYAEARGRAPCRRIPLRPDTVIAHETFRARVTLHRSREAAEHVLLEEMRRKTLAASLRGAPESAPIQATGFLNPATVTEVARLLGVPLPETCSVDEFAALPSYY